MPEFDDEFDEFDDEFEDEVEPADEADEIDTEALARAVAESESVSDDPNIDTPPVPGGSQLPDHAGSPMPELPSLSKILRGEVPTFLVHKSHQYTQRHPEVMGVARRVTQGRIGLGAVVRLPRMSPTAAKTFLDSCHHTSIRIADPEVHAIATTGSPAKPITPRHQQHYPWAKAIPTATAPQSERDAWIAQVLDAQLSAGGNVLLSPTGWVAATQAHASLQAAMSWVAQTRNVVGADTPMFVNLTLAGEWLKTPPLRKMLLQEIVESNEPLWYIRVRWPIIEPRYGQLTDAAMLDGYKQLALTAALERKVLLLPNSGLTGWMATALGASGFSTGMSWPEQAFADERRFGSQPNQPRPPHAQRYFERSVLHPLLWTDAQNLANVQAHRTCQCRYCLSMRANTHTKELAGGHYLVRAARLLDELGSTNRRLEALRIVRAAQAFVAGLDGTANALPVKWQPRHLASWEAHLL